MTKIFFRGEHSFGFTAGIVAIIGALLSVVLGGCSPAAKDYSSMSGSVQVSESGIPVTIGLTYIPNVQFSPLYVAAEDNIFSAAGLKVSLRHHGSDEGLFTALANGDENVTIASGDEVLQARSQGLDVVSIGAYYHKYPIEILTKADSGLDTVKSLKGKRVGVPGEFGSSWFGLLVALKEAGMDTSDITVVPVGYTQASSLVSGDVDAIVAFANSEAVQLSQMGIKTNAIALSSQPVPLVSASIVASSKWVEENPDAAKNVVSAITSGVARVIASPQHAVEVTQQWDPSLADSQARQGALATLEATIELLKSSDGKASATQDLDTWKQMAEFLSEILDQPKLPDLLPQAVTNEYAGG